MRISRISRADLVQPRIFMGTAAVFVLAMLTCPSGDARGQNASNSELDRHEWTVDGVSREGLIHAPPSAKSDPTPVVFAFHGHGGTARNAARSFGIHRIWPEAIVVYLQGLNTPGRLTDPEGKKPGWQGSVGAQGDRDLKFFDVVLESLRKDYKIDDRRIYATGHSNGGGFTYLLWEARGEVLAAVAPSASAAGRRMSELKPKPVLHIAGETDPLVRFAWQKQTIDRLREINGCGEGNSDGKGYTEYASDKGTPVATLIHPGGHKFLAEAPPVIVRYFKEHAKPELSESKR